VSVGRYLPLRKYFFRYLDLQLAMLVCSLLSGFGGVLSPYITKLTFDYAYANRDLQLLFALALAGLLMMFFSMAGSSVQQYLQLHASQRLTYAMRADFLRHLYRLPLSYFQSRTTGEHIYRLGSDIPAAAGFVGGVVGTVINPFVSAIYPLAAVLWMDWRFAVLAGGIAPILALHSRYFGRRQRELARKTANEQQRTSSEVTDRIAQVKLVKAFGREKREIREYLCNQIKLIRLAFRGYWLNFKSGTISNAINTVLQGGVGFYLGYRVIRGDMTVGTLIALSMYFVQLLGAARGLAGLYQSILSQLVPVDRVLDVLEVEGEVPERPGARQPGALDGIIALRDVQFGYIPERPILDRVNLTIMPGTMVGIAGPSGGGKTTLLNLLLRLYDPDSGTVSIGDVDVRDFRLRPLRRKIGIVLQETYLFNTTIRENITYGDPDATEDEVIAAAKLADAHEFIEALPHGYDTTVGEDGCQLSMGQRQRIGIARALIKQPKLLILDEATASLSSSSEAKILDALRPTQGERTLIVVTHRLAAIRQADRIFVLDEGRVVEEGSHVELMARHGLYRALWDRQFGTGETAGLAAAASGDAEGGNFNEAVGAGGEW